MCNSLGRKLRSKYGISIQEELIKERHRLECLLEKISKDIRRLNIILIRETCYNISARWVFALRFKQPAFTLMFHSNKTLREYFQYKETGKCQ